MVVLVAFVLAALSGAAAWREARSFEREHGQLFFGIEPRLAAGGVGVLAGVIAYAASPLILAALVALAVFHEAAIFEDHHREPALDVPARIWAGVGGVFALFGALFTSTVLWGAVCAFFLLAGALYFAIRANKALTAHRDALLADNSALIAERTKLQEAAVKPQKRTLESFERRRTATAAATQAAWNTPAPGGDLLPRAR
jgi:hypothetical protein